MNSVIHHYTSAHALRCITRSKKLRFTRLDKFDDVLEGQSHAGIEFGSQFFASCWVRNPEEDIVQWKLYGNSMRGVRLSLPHSPFNQHLLNGTYPVPGTSAHWQFDRVVAPFTLDEIIGDGYLLFPTCFVENAGSFLRDVIYVEDVSKAYRDRISEGDGIVTISGAPSDLAYFKWNRWEFQKESRFVLQAFLGVPGGRESPIFGSEYLRLIREGALKKGPEVENIYLNLSDDAIRRMVVTLGPLMAEEDKKEVISFLSKHAPHATVVQSTLTGTVR